MFLFKCTIHTKPLGVSTTKPPPSSFCRDIDLNACLARIRVRQTIDPTPNARLSAPIIKGFTEVLYSFNNKPIDKPINTTDTCLVVVMYLICVFSLQPEGREARDVYMTTWFTLIRVNRINNIMCGWIALRCRTQFGERTRFFFKETFSTRDNEVIIRNDIFFIRALHVNRHVAAVNKWTSRQFLVAVKGIEVYRWSQMFYCWL